MQASVSISDTHSQSARAPQREKIMIVDDHPIILLALEGLISKEPGFDVCCHAGSIQDAMLAMQQRPADLVIVDIMLGDGSGLDLIRRLKSKYSDMRFLVMSMRDEEVFAEKALLAGAMGYISKREITDKVLVAIRRVLNDKVYLSERMTERLLHGMVGHSEEWWRPTIQKLSDRELEVLDLIGQGESSAEIAKLLKLSVKTIESHRENIKKKLGITSYGKLVHFAVQWSMRPF